MNFWLVRLGSVILAILGVFGLEAIVTGIGNDYLQRLAVLAGLYVTLAVSLNLINGITGQFSIGHAAFYQVGAYVTGIMTVKLFAAQPLNPIMWLMLMVVVGGIAAAIAGLVVGLPSLRLRGDYLAIVTLGFGEIIRIVTINLDVVGGSSGMNIAPEIGSLPLVWLLAILCIAVCRNLLKTAHGLPFLAVREDEVASSAMGVNVTRVKVVAFLVGSAFAGAAGALLGHYEGFINPDMFKMEISFLILTMVVLGGTGSITGSTIAAMLLFAIPEAPRLLVDDKGRPIMVTAAALLAAVLFLIGAVYLIKRLIDHFHGTKAQRTGRIIGVVLGAFVGTAVFAKIFGFIPVLANKSWEAGQLRMVLLAVSLIVLMLLRPQGIFGHHEFSWGWLRGRKKVTA